MGGHWTITDLWSFVQGELALRVKLDNGPILRLIRMRYREERGRNGVKTSDFCHFIRGGSNM